MPTILVVDDSPVDRQLFAKLLEKIPDTTLVTAENGNEAIQKIVEWGIDLVVTDLQMPEMDGLQLVERLRDGHAEVPTILVTGVGSEEIATQALNAGASSYVPKDQASELLVPTVNSVLELMFADHSFVKLLSKTTETRFEFEIENDESYFPAILELTEKMLEGLSDLDRINRLRVGVAVQHALQNALYRGNLEIDSSQPLHNRGQAEREKFEALVVARKERFSRRLIHVRLDIEPGEFVCTVRDDGRGFEPVASDSMQDHAGRGLMIMKTFMNSVEFNRLGNQVVLIKSWASDRRKPKYPVIDEEELLKTQAMNLGIFSACDGDLKVELVDPILMVGSAYTSHIVLRDNAVDSEHCRLVFKEGIWYIESISSQPIQLNGAMAMQSRIMPGDRVKIGNREYQLDYKLPT